LLNNITNYSKCVCKLKRKKAIANLRFFNIENIDIFTYQILLIHFWEKVEINRLKIIKLVPIVLIFAVAFSNIIPTSAFNVVVGQVVEYDEVRQVWNYGKNSSKSSGTGFSFNGVHFSNDTLISAEVEATSSGSVGYTITVGTESDSLSTSHQSNSLSFYFLMLTPISMLYFLRDTWNKTLLNLGPNIFRIFFLDFNNMNSEFQDLSNVTALEEFFDDPAFDINRVNGTYATDGNLGIYNYLLDCTLIGYSGLDTFSGNYTYQIVYDTSCDVVQGFELLINFDGTLGFTDYTIFRYFKYEIIGYDLPDFVFDVDVTLAPELEPVITKIGSLGLLIISVAPISFSGLAIIISKRKMRK